MVTVTVGEPTHAVSDRLYGVFFEDINLGADGGLNANMVNNYSFDGVYLDHHSLRVQGSQRSRAQSDPLRFWQFEGLSAVSCGTQRPDEHGRPVSTDCPAPPVHPHSRYARLSVHGGHGIEPAPARVENLGYNGGGANAHACAMSIVKGHGYEFSMVLRPVAGDCDIRVSVVDRYGLPLTDAATFRCDATASDATVSVLDTQASVRREADDWHLLAASLQGRGTEYGKLRIDLIRRDGEPVVCDLDCVTLMDAEYWGRGDPKWRFGRLRRDLVEAIAALKPSFIRFPGGCIVEGVTPGNEYRWKDTVGALPARRQQYSMWGVPHAGRVQLRAELPDRILRVLLPVRGSQRQAAADAVRRHHLPVAVPRSAAYRYRFAILPRCGRAGLPGPHRFRQRRPRDEQVGPHPGGYGASRTVRTGYDRHR